MKKQLFLIMILFSIPVFALNFTSDGKHNLDKAKGQYRDAEVFQKNEKWYITIGYGTGTETKPVILNKDGTFSIQINDYEKLTYAYDIRLKTLVTVAVNDHSHILYVHLPKMDIKLTTNGKFKMEQVKGYWCDELFEIVQKNGKWYWIDDENKYTLLTVTKDGFSAKLYKDRIFSFDTKYNTLVEIDKNKNIKHVFILKEECPSGYN